MGLLLHKTPVPITQLVWYANAHACNAEAPQDRRRAGSVEKPRRVARLLFNSKRRLPWISRPLREVLRRPPSMSGRPRIRTLMHIRRYGCRKAHGCRRHDNNRGASLFMSRLCASRVFQSPCCHHSSAGTPVFDAARAHHGSRIASGKLQPIFR